MSKNIDCYDRVITLLNTAKTSGSLTYVKQIYEGLRNDIPGNAEGYPSIVVEPVSEDEVNKHISAGKTMHLTLNIWCFIFSVNRANQIAGEPANSNKGILEMVNDIKNVLGADVNLNQTCMDFEFPTVQYNVEMSQFPVMRYGIITMRIRYVATATTR
jgi:hypothetical protein